VAQGKFSVITSITITRRSPKAVSNRHKALCAIFNSMDPALVDTAHLHPVPELKRRGVPLNTNLDPII
jgi:hypothetical protein